VRTQRYMWPLKLRLNACKSGDRACVKSIERLTHKDTLLLWQSAVCLAAATQASGLGLNADHALGMDWRLPAVARPSRYQVSISASKCDLCALDTRASHEHLFAISFIRESA
jgi:hypothetical protein